MNPYCFRLKIVFNDNDYIRTNKILFRNHIDRICYFQKIVHNFHYKLFSKCISLPVSRGEQVFLARLHTFLKTIMPVAHHSPITQFGPQGCLFHHGGVKTQTNCATFLFIFRFYNNFLGCIFGLSQHL